MDWSTAYLACFVLGLTFVGLSFLAGQFGGHGTGHDAGHEVGGHDGDVGETGESTGGHGFGGHDTGTHDLSGHGHAGTAHGGSDHDFGLPLFSPTVLAIFVGMFGGGGLMLLRGFGVTAPLIHVPGAAAISLGSGFGVAWTMMKLMRHAESNSVPTHAQLVGRTVEVVASIRGTEIGEIAYEAGGTRQTILARSVAGQSFAQGDAVQVARVVEGIAHVAPVGTVQPLEITTSMDGAVEPRGGPTKDRTR